MSKIYKVALVRNGIVDNVILAKKGFDPGIENCTMVFLSEVVDDTTEVPIYKKGQPNIGDVWNGTVFHKPDLSKKELTDMAKQFRKSFASTDCVLFKDFRIPASPDNLRVLKDLREALSLDGVITVDFKVNGTFINLNVTDLQKLIPMVTIKIQAHFSLESKAVALINSGSITKQAQLQELFANP